MWHHQWIGILAGCGAISKITLPCGAIASWLGLTTSVMSQIVPDNMGVESSVVTPNVPHQGNLIERIDGGATRGSSLLHSFGKFSIGNGQKVYFANPAAIENILGRVTGNQVSEIFGTLGVLGDANLYLINPNGIIFGENAQLDVAGSFFASTNDSLFFENGYQFSSNNTDAPPLLTLNIRPGLQTGLPANGTISNQGNLSVGQYLNLVGNNLNLEGQLHSGGNLTLQATNKLQVRDRVSNPFIASAGEQLLIEGNKIDIFALNHPDSGFFSTGNMALRSNQAIGVNAQFSSGGSFRIEQFDGSQGDLSSTDDPVIRSSGDVSFGNYTGPSLHIFAGGSVTADSIEITGPDTTNFINETVTLSDGETTVNISGSSEPTLDIRAGTTAFNPPGNTGDTTGFLLPVTTTGTGTNANITIDSIETPGGLVFLTNQYQPNPELSGDITVSTNLSTGGSPGGDVFIDSRGKIITPANPDAGLFVSTLDTSGSNGEPGGDITVLAIGDIIMPRFSKITSYGSGGGDIILKSDSAIIQEEGSVADFDSYIESGVVGGSEPGGDVILEAPSIVLSNFVQSSTYGGDGSGGDLIITADSFTVDSEGALVSTYAVSGNAGDTKIMADSISLNDAVLGSLSESSIGGDAGDVLITTNSFKGTNGGQVISDTGGSADGDDRANAGNVNVTADTISLIGTQSGSDIFSGFGSNVRPGAQGDGGKITISTRILSLEDGAEIRTSTSGTGNAGEINVFAEESIVMDGSVLSPVDNETVINSGILSEVRPEGEGDGGVITVKTGQLSVTNGAFLSATTLGIGDAGDIFIEATESASFDGNPGEPLLPSGVYVRVQEGAMGDGGTLKITTPSLSVTNGAQLQAQLKTGAQGDTGTIMINASDSVVLSGEDTGLFSNTEKNTTGKGGDIMIANPELVEIRDGAAISVDSQGSGEGGNVQIMADKLILEDQGLISAETASTDGGDINLNLSDYLLLRRNSLISTTAGTAAAGGNGGSITIDTDFIAAVDEENSDITANAFEGNGGRIEITATGIFGIEFREQLTPLSDITASSELGISGNVSINDPEVDPESGLVELPADLTDASNQVITACAAAEGNSFTITGRGGLPTDPTAPIRGQTLLSDLRDFTTTERENQAENPLPNSPSPKPERQTVIVEATSWRINGEGKIELVAALPKESLPQRPITCNKS